MSISFKSDRYGAHKIM